MLHRVLPILLASLISATAAEPTVIELKTLQAQMRYSVTEINTTPGAPLKIHFENADDMPHNFVLCQAGTDVVAMCNRQLEKPEEAVKRNFLPEDPAIWMHSKVLNPHESEDLAFNAPEKPGDYPFVCTMPGHAMTMRGRLRIFAPGPGLTDLSFKLYLGEWDKLPDFSTLQPYREGAIPENLLQLKFDDYKNNYGIVFEGKIKAPQKGEYNFDLSSDDGSRILVDGKKIVEDDGVHPAADIHHGKASLEAGEHAFRLEYFQKGNDAQLYAGWRGPTFAITPLSKWQHPKWNGQGPVKKEDHTGMPLVVEKEPVLYRNFITGAGNRGIGVGYPGGVNIAWSAESMNLALVWRGAFIDAARHWTDRGGGAQPPLGYDVFSPQEGLTTPFCETGESGKAAWQVVNSSDRPSEYQWKGYRLDAQRFPTFNYEWKGVKVTDRFDVEGNGAMGTGKLIRTLKLEGNIPPTALFRAASGASIQQGESGFAVKSKKHNVDGHDVEASFTVSAPNARIAGNDLVVPAAHEIKVTYSWPMEMMQHAHAQ